MQQLSFIEVPSPCIGVCESGPRGYCRGCFRSRDERLHWVKLDNDTKLKIVKACARRKQRSQQSKDKAKLTHSQQSQQGWDF